MYINRGVENIPKVIKKTISKALDSQRSEYWPQIVNRILIKITIMEYPYNSQPVDMR